MNLPNLKEAKIRTKKEIKIIRDDYKVSDSMKEIGKNKLSRVSFVNFFASKNLLAFSED